MNLRRNLIIALLMTLVTTVLYGIIYPLAVTAMAQLLFPDKANGQLLTNKDGAVIGSAIIAQPFSRPEYFHPRPSGAGNGYDAAASGGTNLGPTSKKLSDAVAARVADAHAENPSIPVPIDLVTSSGSGLDPDISPAAARFQAPRVARARGVPEEAIQKLVDAQTTARQFGVLGEPTVNVLLLNLALDAQYPRKTRPPLIR